MPYSIDISVSEIWPNRKLLVWMAQFPGQLAINDTLFEFYTSRILRRLARLDISPVHSTCFLRLYTVNLCGYDPVKTRVLKSFRDEEMLRRIIRGWGLNMERPHGDRDGRVPYELDSWVYGGVTSTSSTRIWALMGLNWRLPGWPKTDSLGQIQTREIEAFARDKERVELGLRDVPSGTMTICIRGPHLEGGGGNDREDSYLQSWVEALMPLTLKIAIVRRTETTNRQSYPKPLPPPQMEQSSQDNKSVTLIRCTFLGSCRLRVIWWECRQPRRTSESTKSSPRPKVREATVK